MSFPTVTVEVAEVTSGLPAYDDVDWVDVSDKSLEASTRVGRTDELSSFSAGTLSLRMLSPDPMDIGWLIRLRAAHDATELPLFTGRITSITKTPVPGAGVVMVELDATDITEAIAAEELSMTRYAKAVAADAPVYYWPLDSSTQTTSPWPNRFVDGLADGVPDSAMGFAEIYDTVRSYDAPMLTDTDFTVEFWVKTRTTVPKNWVAPIFSRGAAPSPSIDPISICITSEGLLFGVGTSSKVASIGISDGKTHHIACTYSLSGGAKKIWVDGVDRTGLGATLIAARWAPRAVNDPVIGFRTPLSDQEWWNMPFVGTLDEFALYDYVLTSEQIHAHSDLGRYGEVATTLAERVEDLVTLAGLDASWLNADASAEGTDVFTRPVLNESLMGELQTLATAHASRIHSDETGRLSVYGFDWFPAPVAHYSDEGDALPYLAAGFALEQSRDDIANIVTGSQVGGPTLTVSDDASIGRYGRHSADFGSLRATSSGAVQTAIERHLDRYRAPVERFKTISLAPQSDPALWPAVAASVVSSAVTVTYDSTTADYLVEGVSHRIEPGEWTTTLALSPAPVDDFWRWDEGTLDTDARWA